MLSSRRLAIRRSRLSSSLIHKARVHPDSLTSKYTPIFIGDRTLAVSQEIEQHLPRGFVPIYFPGSRGDVLHNNIRIVICDKNTSLCVDEQTLRFDIALARQSFALPTREMHTN